MIPAMSYEGKYQQSVVLPGLIKLSGRLVII